MAITIPAAIARNHMAHRPGMVQPAPGAGWDPRGSGDLTPLWTTTEQAMKTAAVRLALVAERVPQLSDRAVLRGEVEGQGDVAEH